MAFAVPAHVLPSREAREELPKALARFRKEGASAEPVIFGSHRKPEGVVIPFALYASLLPAIEELEIAEIVRQRTAAGAATPLSDLASEIGLDPADYA
jgi:antitoxin StbD